MSTHRSAATGRARSVRHHGRHHRLGGWPADRSSAADANGVAPPAGVAPVVTPPAATAPGVAEPVRAQPPPDPTTDAPHRRRLRNGIVFAAVLSVIAGALVLAVPGLRTAVHRLGDVNPGWIAAAVALELVSCLGYVLAFALVFDAPARGPSARVAWAEMAFGAVVPIGGAGGIALGGWMLHQRGMSVRRIAERSAVLFWLTSAVNVAVLVLAGLALASGALPGPHNLLLTALPAGVGLLVLGLFMILPHGAHRLPPEGRLATAARAAAGTVTATEQLLIRPRRRLIGAPAYLGADMAVLWCCLAALGVEPSPAVLALAYLIGYLPNVLPIPGGIGILDAGLVGALVLYHVPAADAVTAVLIYHTIALWLPTIGGTIAFIGARRDLHPPVHHDLHPPADAAATAGRPGAPAVSSHPTR